MAHLIPNGKHYSTLILRFVFAGVFCFFFSPLRAQSIVCTPFAGTPPVAVEGLTERGGDIALTCGTGTPGTTFSTNLTVSLNTNITNRISGTNVPDITLSGGATPVTLASKQLMGTNAVTFNGITFTLPASGMVTLVISNIRANVNGLGSQPLVATFTSSAIPLSTSQVVFGFPNRALLATLTNAGISCAGSSFPASINLTNLFAAGTRFVSTRVTEGYATAFHAKDAMSDTGTRILVSFNGLPAGARLLLPDLIAGSDASQPTAGGDIGTPQAGGTYIPSSGTLLLARVNAADANGAGGTPMYTPGPPGPAVTFNTVSEMALTAGAGTITYEVVDSNPFVVESAQFPTFLGLSGPLTQMTVGNESVSLAPLSSVNVATAADPIPRFVAMTPPSDCPALGDCNASYFPILSVPTTAVQLSASTGGAPQTQHITINNVGSGLLNWNASITYQNGSGWLSPWPTSGSNDVWVTADPAKLAPGTYQAMLLIDAGPLSGSRSIPVTFVVGSAAPPPVTVSSVTNAASLTAGPLVAGSLAAVKGTNLSGKNVSVTFDNIPASLLYDDSRQINLQVPAAVSAKTSSQMIVTVDGFSSAPQAVALAPTAPAIFTNGVLNQDYSLNTPNSGAPAGSFLQIFLTGLNPDAGPVTVKVHDRDNLVPTYAGPAPTLPGVQQVDVAIPADLPAMQSEVKICSAGVCTTPMVITIR